MTDENLIEIIEPEEDFQFGISTIPMFSPDGKLLENKIEKNYPKKIIKIEYQ
jgi:hypothetical protein